jgi:hypothetical protein
MERTFIAKFKIDDDGKIQTQIESKNVKPLEAIALLEMAKDQMMNNIRKGTQNVFNLEKKG